MLDPGQAIDRIVAAQKASPGHRALHAKGDFYSGTFNASPEAKSICRALHLSGISVPILVRWSHGSGRLDANDEKPYVRGMAVSFVLPDGSSTDLLGQTIPRFPVRTPEDFVTLIEVARDKKELAKFLVTRPRTALAIAHNQRVRALGPPHSYAEATYYPIHAYRWVSMAGVGTWVRYRMVPQAQPSDRPGGRFAGRERMREEILARLERAPVRFDLVVTVAGPKDDPHNPMSVWKGSRDFVAGWLEVTTPEDDREAQGDVVVFDPTRVVDGIELSDDPILRYRPQSYSVSIDRRTGGPH
jgi:catalase